MTTVPDEGRQTLQLDSADLVGVDGNAFAILGRVDRWLRDAGATKAFRDAYYAEATSGDYDHVIAASIAYLDAEPVA